MPAVVCGFIERIRWCKFSGRRHKFKCIMTSVSSESTEIRRNKERPQKLTVLFGKAWQLRISNVTWYCNYDKAHLGEIDIARTVKNRAF